MGIFFQILPPELEGLAEIRLLAIMLMFAGVEGACWNTGCLSNASVPEGCLPSNDNQNDCPEGGIVYTCCTLLSRNIRQAKESGICSWYTDDETACGDPFNKDAMTAAHKTLPCGTWIRVRNCDNGKTVDVKIIDRGPYVAGRILDLTPAAFSRLANLDKGLTCCSYTIL